jgi:hypothetical protein
MKSSMANVSSFFPFSGHMPTVCPNQSIFLFFFPFTNGDPNSLDLEGLICVMRRDLGYVVRLGKRGVKQVDVVPVNFNQDGKDTPEFPFAVLGEEDFWWFMLKLFWS